MAQYNGHVSIPHDSYDAWRSATINNGYNVDGAYGNQCWDLCEELWYQYGLTLYTGNGYAYGCWTIARNQNAQGPFEIVNGAKNIKRGDILVFNYTSTSATGHICFADEDYQEGMTRISTFGQVPAVFGLNGTAQVYPFNLANFLGIFRNTQWDSTPPPTPSGTRKKSKFPWAVAWAHWPNFRD